MKKIYVALTALVLVTLACQNNVFPASDQSLTLATATPALSRDEVQAMVNSQFATQVASVVNATVSAIPTQILVSTPTQTADVKSTVVPEVGNAAPESSLTIGKWEVTYFDGVTDQMKSWIFKDLDPAAWKVFPNVDNGQYKAADGVEYGMAESVFCQQDQRCDFEVAARHYRLYTGDYKIDGIGECHATDGIGCAVAVFNGGDVTSFLASQEMHDGFTVTGRYWNGDKMPQDFEGRQKEKFCYFCTSNDCLKPTSLRRNSFLRLPWRFMLIYCLVFLCVLVTANI